MNPWRPITNQIDLKHLGKLGEEAGELAEAAAHCFYHAGGYSHLCDEIADVYANSELVIQHFELDNHNIMQQAQGIVEERQWGRLSALAESAAHLATAVCRCIIQGVDEAEPITGKVNRVWLEESLAKVYANMDLVIKSFGFDRGAIMTRGFDKKLKLRKWHAMADGGFTEVKE